MSTRADRIVHGIALGTACLCALSALPQPIFEPLWFVLLAAPAALLAIAQRLPDVRWCGARTRFLLAVLLQLELLKLGLHHLGPVHRVPALTLVLVPPMAWLAIRRKGADGALALFLSLCILMIATMLPAPGVRWQAAAWFASASLALCTDTSLQVATLRHSVRARVGSTLLLWRARLLVVAAQGLATVTLLTLLMALPTPLPRVHSGTEVQRPDSERAKVRLSDRFDLDGKQGTALEFLGEEILVVKPYRGRPKRTPDDLYLRSTFFDRAQLRQWTLSGVQTKEHDTVVAPLKVAERLPGAEANRLEIQRREPSGLVLTPPGLFEIFDVPTLEADTRRGWYHEKGATGPLDYVVGYQDLSRLAATADVDYTLANGLTQLPRELKDARISALLNELEPRKTLRPYELASTLTVALQNRYEYSIEEPRGTDPHAIFRFLFESKKGYCMHFATALAVMLRHSNVPCRIAVGLQGGTPDPEDPAARRFGQKHAHAWVEIPFQGIGWVVFDPTPPLSLPSQQRALPAKPAEPPQEPESGPTNLVALLDLWLPDGTSKALAAAGAVFVVAMLLGMLRRKRTVGPRARPLTAAIHQARRLLAQVLKAMQQRGLGRGPGQTLEQWLASLADRPDVDRQALAAAVDAYQAVRFGGQELDAARRHALESAVP